MKEKDINTHVVAVSAIVKKGNKYLLAKRSSSDPQAGGEWAFPGGKVDLETGDSILENTLAREVLEEVGVKIKNHVNLICNNAFIRISSHHVVMITFLCYWKSGCARALEDQEEVRWLTLAEMLAMKNEIPDYTLKKIRALKKYESSHKEK